MKKVVLMSILATLAHVLMAQADGITGTWLIEAQDAKIEIYKSGTKYFGKMIWLTPDKDDLGKPLTDSENPDPAKRKQPLLGLIIIHDMVFGKEEWNGKIYDPESGKTYQAQIEMPNAETLKLRGYIGSPIFGRTETWKRTR